MTGSTPEPEGLSEGLQVHRRGPAAVLTLARPERRNALTPDGARRLAEQIERWGACEEVHAVVLTGAGGHFCAGLDLQWLAGRGELPSPHELQAGIHDFQSVVLAVVRCPVPVIAQLRGTVAGFGLDLAVACDMRLADGTVRLTSAFARMGLVPDGGSTITLPGLIGRDRALRFLTTGETLDADAAAACGLLTEVTTPDALDGRVDALAAELAGSAPESVRAIKHLCRAFDLGIYEQVLAMEAAAQVQALRSDAFRGRLAAFLGDRALSAKV